ncbi:MAG: 50S ribosomal protein L29 [Candidatus Woesearchaeota archaeon]
MKTKELRSMNATELAKKLVDLQKEMVKFNAQVASGSSLKSPSLVRNTKRTIARIHQELARKQAEKEAVNG